jgi:hypothetical protein
MKYTLLSYLSILCSALNVHGLNSSPIETRKETEQVSTPESVKFAESVRKLVRAVNEGDVTGSLQKLHDLDKDIPPRDPRRPRAAFLDELRYLDSKVIGTFEESLVARYDALVADPERLTAADKSEFEMIAALAKEAMSLKLAKLFLRDIKKVEPYIFKEKVDRRGWRPSDVDDWRGLQGRMVSASVACDDLPVLNEWIALAEKSTGDFRLLIWWGLGNSLREEAFTYLMKQHSQGLDGREKIIVEYALTWEMQRISSLSKRSEKNPDNRFGVLTPAEIEKLRVRLQKLAPQLQERLKSANISKDSPGMFYRD